MHAPHIHWYLDNPNDPFIADDGDGGPEEEGDTSPDPIQHVLPQVIEATNRVLIGNGDLDMIIITNGTLLAIQNMTWNGKHLEPSIRSIELTDNLWLDRQARFSIKAYGVHGRRYTRPRVYGRFRRKLSQGC